MGNETFSMSLTLWDQGGLSITIFSYSTTPWSPITTVTLFGNSYDTWQQLRHLAAVTPLLTLVVPIFSCNFQQQVSLFLLEYSAGIYFLNTQLTWHNMTQKYTYSIQFNQIFLKYFRLILKHNKCCFIQN